MDDFGLKQQLNLRYKVWLQHRVGENHATLYLSHVIDVRASADMPPGALDTAEISEFSDISFRHLVAIHDKQTQTCFLQGQL